MTYLPCHCRLTFCHGSHSDTSITNVYNCIKSIFGKEFHQDNSDCCYGNWARISYLVCVMYMTIGHCSIQLGCGE